MFTLSSLWYKKERNYAKNQTSTGPIVFITIVFILPGFYPFTPGSNLIQNVMHVYSKFVFHVGWLEFQVIIKTM